MAGIRSNRFSTCVCQLIKHNQQNQISLIKKDFTTTNTGLKQFKSSQLYQGSSHHNSNFVRNISKQCQVSELICQNYVFITPKSKNIQKSGYVIYDEQESKKKIWEVRIVHQRFVSMHGSVVWITFLDKI